jgi:type II secretory pathway component GspD/PulD (secretin)
MKKLIFALIGLFIFASSTLAPEQSQDAQAKASENFNAVTNQERADAYYSQGYLYYQTGDYKEAGPEFLKALNLNPRMAKAHFWLGKVNYKLGKYKTVIANCENALEISPNFTPAKELLKDTQKMLGIKQTPYSSPKTAVAVKETPVKTSDPEKPAVSAAQVQVKEQEQPAQKPAKRNLISLDLRNVDISSVLQILSKETGYDIIAGRDVYGKITISVNNMDADEVLDMVLKSNGFTYIKDGNVIHVYSSGDAPRIEELPDGSFVRTFMINYIQADNLKDTLVKLMPEAASVYTTKGSNIIVIRGSANDIKRAEVLIRNMDIPPKQVMVEAKIIEVSVDQGQHSGVNAQYTNPDNATEVAQTVGLANAPSATGATGLYYTVTNSTLTYLVEQLSTRSGFNILSSPKVMAMNDETAQIITGSRLGYKIKTVTTTGMVESIEFLDVGTQLIITPSVKSDGMIVMEIHPEISEGAIVNDLPQKTTTQTTTKLIVKDGQTIVIGGLIRDSQKKETKGVPLIMDIPVIGWAFKKTDLTSEKKEVIVLITPHIVDAKYNAEMEDQANEMEKRKTNSDPVLNLDIIR